jgi:hypothetical protein
MASQQDEFADPQVEADVLEGVERAFEVVHAEALGEAVYTQDGRFVLGLRGGL